MASGRLMSVGVGPGQNGSVVLVLYAYVCDLQGAQVQ